MVGVIIVFIACAVSGCLPLSLACSLLFAIDFVLAAVGFVDLLKLVCYLFDFSFSLLIRGFVVCLFVF